MARFNNKILTILTLLVQVIQVFGLPDDSIIWLGGHYDSARAVAFGGVLTDLGQQVGLCGCYEAGSAHIISNWQATGY